MSQRSGMFTTTTSPDSVTSVLLSDENAKKWKGIFIKLLKMVQRQVHSDLSAKEDALDYIEGLLLQLLVSLCASQPQKVQDVEDRIQKTFPDPIDKWAIKDAKEALERAPGVKAKKNSNQNLPVDKVHPLLKELLGYRVDYSVAVYMVAVLEYIAADILKFTGTYVKNIRHGEITCQDVKVAICADQVLIDMFSQEEEMSMSMVENEPIHRDSLKYEDIVKDFILEETQYLRDLNLIIKVFRVPFAKLFPRSKDLDVIFSNILDIYDLTTKLLSLVEDQVEITDERETPLVGTCFEDIAEGEEFNVYEKYVDDMMAPRGKERLYTLLQREDVSQYMQSAGHGFKGAVKYVLPKLLLGPVYHCLHYFEVIDILIESSKNEEDQECLEQANSLLQALKASMERKFGGAIPKRKPWEISLRLQGRFGRPEILEKMNEIQKSIDGWEGKTIGQSCSEFIMDGELIKHTGRRPSDRHVFLFDNLIVLCKHNRRSSVTGSISEYKLKEKYYVRKVEIKDREDTDDLKHVIELHPRDHPGVILTAKNAEDKANWMAALISLQTRSMLERALDGKLREEEKQHPLCLPTPQQYRFAEENSEENIVFEENQDPSIESPLIKGGLLIKLIERLTYHMYADPKFVRTFLTTYRSFCSPHELLDLLIERFEIPDIVVQQDDIGVDHQKDPSLKTRDDLKRFRKEYVKPIQFRVVNVLKHWVDQHFYDFERDDALLTKLERFLSTIKGKAMKKMAESINKVVSRRQESSNTEREITYQTELPAIEWHLTQKPEEFDLMKLHPIEIARQVTLLEFDLYRAVQPSELVGSVWIKKNKDKTSPNLLKMIHFSTMFTFWLEKCIIETDNLEERVAVMSRILEIMLVFQELNNFNGVLEVVSAMNSAPVYRLEHTFKELPHKLYKSFDEAKELNSDHFKKYTEKLRSINPPCVPFLGMYLTNILLTEEGNPDFLPNRPKGLINFSKRRKVAEITAEIQQYQNQPYCLSVENSIREFFEKLNPLEDRCEKDFNDYLYAKSLEIEPRGSKQAVKYPKKFLDFSLKSPGVKPLSGHRQSSARSSQPTTFPFNVPKNSEDDDSSSPSCATPPTPSTPLTPTLFSGSHLGSMSTLASSTSTLMGSTHSVLTNFSNDTSILSEFGYGLELDNALEKHVLTPPPLPPRRKHNDSECSLSGLSLSDNPPIPPPRHDEERPPPVPPRRDSFKSRDSVFSTLPRSQSISHQPRPVMPPSTSSTLPRHNSERGYPSNLIFDINGDDPPGLPEIPPRTYKIVHSRKQSS
ncbi:son of sevenless homolog 1 [Patella vulgata]|uniref:son of sevenless homolog 1 n=1 Tax=Patella vulgata TaxID=6465 RepID=UPI0021806279|nr:son of sevenless homolog 1 [Patella vulgata]